MAGSEPERVTPSGVRDGDPAALAALCAARGPAVLAYTGAVLPGDLPFRGAAEAFARFRAAVIALGDTPGVDPDRLLLGAVRRATAALTPPPPPSRLTSRAACVQLPQLLAARLEGELSAADEARVARHLVRCSGCRELAARFEAAERAFASPPDGPVPADAIPAIVGALATAGGPLAPTPEQITAEFAALPPEAVLAPPAPAATEPGPPAGEPPPAAVAPPAPPPAAAEPEPPAAVQPEPPAPDPAGLRLPSAAALTGRLAALRRHRARPAPPAPVGPPPVAADAVTSLMPPVGRAGPAGPAPAEPVAASPRPPAFARPPRPRPHRPQGDVLRTVVLPLSVVGVAAVLAMAIAGIFGEEDPAPLPGAPVITAPAETIPGPRGAGAEPTTVRPGQGPPPGVPRSGEQAFPGGLGVPGPGAVPGDGDG